MKAVLGTRSGERVAVVQPFSRPPVQAVKGVEPGKAMPIPYTNVCGECRDVDNL